MSDLTIISVAFDDIRHGLLDLMIRSVIKNTDVLPYFIICDSGRNDLEKYNNTPNFTVIQNPAKKDHGSLQHGCGINAALKLSKTKYTAIIESDCIVLSNDWHRFDRQYKIMASKKGPDLYHVCFMVFETELLRGVDFRPGNDRTRSNRPYAAKEDVGWQISKVLKHDQIDFVEFVDCKTSAAKIFKSFQSDEFHRDGKVIAAHFGRGSNVGSKAVRKGFDSPTRQLDEWKRAANLLIGSGTSE